MRATSKPSTSLLMSYGLSSQRNARKMFERGTQVCGSGREPLLAQDDATSLATFRDVEGAEPGRRSVFGRVAVRRDTDEEVEVVADVLLVDRVARRERHDRAGGVDSRPAALLRPSS